MHLAKLMHRTVDELLDSMSYPELVDWGEYFELFPEESWRADVRSAQICALLANINRDPKKQPTPFSLDEFMLFNKRVNKAAKVEEEDKGAKIAPETVTFLFAAARRQEKKRLTQ